MKMTEAELLQRGPKAEKLIRAVIQAESGGDATKVSKSGARGIMQVKCAAETMVMRHYPEMMNKPFDPADEAWGVKYLALMLRLFDGDVELALAAYTGGPTLMRRKRLPGEDWQKVKEKYPAGEKERVEKYVTKVMEAAK